ncbi:MAG TPA: glutaredoxin domain-containing protein [Rhodanobacteraceae bacterium]|nr:glutaredoxin domain-containing protein [Rhodanobacteraceae bacterium]
MKAIIYGKHPCNACDKAKLLLRMKSIDFDYLTVGTDISVEELGARIGQRVSSVPQIFLDAGDSPRHIGGYDELRAVLQRPT